MRTTRLLLMLGVLTAAFAAAPQIARADESVTITGCSEDCAGGHWVGVPEVHFWFAWTNDGTQTALSPECNDGNMVSVTAEGDNKITCTVTYPTGAVSATAEVKIDRTPPVPAAAGFATGATANAAGWFSSPFTMNWGWTDALSGVDPNNCDTSVLYPGQQTDGTGVAMDCRDLAGNLSQTVNFAVKYDTVKPDNVDGTPVRPADANGWFNHPVAFVYHGSDLPPGSGIAACDTVAYPGPATTPVDSPAATVTGGCTDNAGNADTTTDSLQYDATPPTVTGATPDRAPDHGDWYTHPVTFAFQGSDATSGLNACTTSTYSGPDDGTASLNGTCTDEAGNSTTKSVSFKYDATPPAKAKLYATPANKAVALSWVPPSDGASFVVARTPAIGGAAPTTVYRGGAHDFVDTGLKNGAKYNYLVTVYDAAGNASPVAGVSAVADGSTLRPFIDTEVSTPPLLSWQTVKKATYYNLQLYKGRKKILSVWPKTPGIQLKASWRFSRHKYTLSKGLYRWYVWPGLGRQSAHRYGALLGSSTFRVVG